MQDLTVVENCLKKLIVEIENEKKKYEMILANSQFGSSEEEKEPADSVQILQTYHHPLYTKLLEINKTVVTDRSKVQQLENKIVFSIVGNS